MKPCIKEQAIEELEKLRKEFDVRTKALEAIINQKDVMWKPKYRDIYYYHMPLGIKWCYWTCHNHDEYRYAVGNCYQTEQKAINARDAIIILTEMQHMADEANGRRLRHTDWQEVDSYAILNDWASQQLSVSCTSSTIVCDTYPCFLTKKSAEKTKDILISKYGEDKVKMALSGTWK